MPGPTSTRTKASAPNSGPGRSSSSRTAPGRTARSNDSTAPWSPNGPTARSSPATTSAPPPLPPGSSTTTLDAATQHLADSHPSADWHQPDGRVHLGRQRNPAELGADGEQALLHRLVVHGRVGDARPLVEEVAAGDPRRRVVRDGEPGLGARPEGEVTRCSGPAHARGHPARVDRVGEHAGPATGHGRGEDGVEELAVRVGLRAVPAPLPPLQ